MQLWAALISVILALGVSCSRVQPKPAETRVPSVEQRTTRESAFHPEKLRAMDHLIHAAIQKNKLPGGVLWLERRGEIYTKEYGNKALVPSVESMSLDTIFDAASLTKVVATTPAVMLLVER